MAHRNTSEQLRQFAKEQRRAMPRAEQIVWQVLRAGRFHKLKFKRQAPIGPYIADFICFESRLIVELDGPPHEKDEQRLYDAQRDAWLREQGFRVLRFKNELILGSAELAFEQLREAAGIYPSPGPR